MMEQFSPISRRIIAIGVLLLLVLCCVTLVIEPLAAACREAVSDLRDARYRREKLEMIAERPPPPSVPTPPPDLTLSGTGNQLTNALGSVIGTAAAARAVTLQNANAHVSGSGLVLEDFEATAPEPALLLFVNDVERARPIVRFMRWRLMAPAEPGGPLKMEATAAAAAAQP